MSPAKYVQELSLFKTLNYKPEKKIKLNLNKNKFNKFENEIIKKIFEWPKIIKISSDKYEPHRIPFYLYELATLFHSYWSKGNDDNKYKFIKNGKISNENVLIVINLVLIVLQNGMNILNVSLPNKM